MCWAPLIGWVVLAAATPSATHSSAESELDVDHGWMSGSVSEQLRRDPTLVSFGKGAIFVPAMTNPLDEPPVVVLQDGQRVTEGTTGRRLLVLPGTYMVRMGSGTVEQRFTAQVTVREQFTSVVPVSWAGLAVHVVDERMNSLRGSYELIRVDDREYLGIGFGSDEEAGEPVSTWILKPGLYKIVRVGETYRARTDYATVRLLPGHLTHFQLVIDEATGDFEGGGEVPQEDLFQYQKGKLWAGLVLGGDLSLNSRQNVLLSTFEGQRYAFRAFLDTKLSADILGSPLILRLQVEEGQYKDPQQPWQPTHDRADLDGLYVYRFKPWIGPYLRFGAETNLLETWQFYDAPTDVRILRADDSLKKETACATKVRISPPLGLTTVKEGAGLNVRVFKSVFGETTVRAGVGARHSVANGLLEQVGDQMVDSDCTTDDTQIHQRDFRRVTSINQVGIEGTVVAIARLTRWVLINLEIDSLVPFDDLNEVVLEVEGTLALKLTRYASVNYVLRFLRDRSLSEKDQLSQDVLLRFSFELL